MCTRTDLRLVNHTFFHGVSCHTMTSDTPICPTQTSLPTPKLPRLPHTSGVHGPPMTTVSQRFIRPEEVVLGVSFNSQSQSPDIRGISLFNVTNHIFLTGSIQGPDIPFLSLCVSTKDLLTVFNTRTR